jgi:hypothetical protein
MEIISTTVTATASLHYQQASLAITAGANLTQDELKSLESVTIGESVKMVKELCAQVGAQPAPDEQPRVQVQSQPQYGTDANPRSFVKDKGYPASPAQIAFLKKCGYQGPTDGLTKMQASNILSNMGFDHKKGDR